MIPSIQARLENAVQGWQMPIVGTLKTLGATAPTTADVAGANGNTVGAISALAGATLAAGTYYFYIGCAGCSAVDVTLRTSSGGANITAASTKLYKTLVDGVTEKMGATGTSGAVAAAAFVDTTQQTISITTLRGEHGCLLKLVCSGAVTFDQAESSAL